MKKTSFILITILTTLFLSTYSWAEERAEISTDDLISFVLSENPDIRISKMDTEQADARIGSAKSKFMPKLTVSASDLQQDNPQGGMFTTRTVAPAMTRPSQSGITTKASASINLFNGFQDQQKIEQRDKELDKAKASLKATSFSQKDKVIISVYQILSIQKDIENIEEKIRIERDREKDLKKRVSSQSARLSDLLAVQSRIVGSTNDLQVSKTDLFVEWNNLSSIAGKNLFPMKVAQPELELTKISKKINTDALPEVKAARLDFESSEFAYHSTRGGLLPSLDVSYNRYFQRPEFQKNNLWDVTVTLSLAIPIDGDRISSIREARALTHQKEIIYQNKKNQQSLEIEKLINEYNSDIDRYHILSEAVGVQDKLVHAFKKDYMAGLVSISDYLNSVSDLIQKRQERDRLLIQQLQKNIQIQNWILSAGEVQ